MNNSNKKVCFLINSLGFGGAERVFVDDANSFFEQGIEIFFIILYGESEANPLVKQLKIPLQNIIFLKARNRYDVNIFKKLFFFLKEKNRLCLYSTLNDANFVSRCISIFFPKIFLVIREANTAENRSYLHKFFDILMNFRANTLVAVSKSVKDSFLSYQPWNKSKTIVVYNGVDIPDIFNKENNETVVLTVGSLTFKKNHSLLIDIFEKIANEFPEVKLHIVGDGILKDELSDIILFKKLQNRIFLLGKKKKEEVFEEYKKASIFVLSSSWEGCPNVLLEAMSFGLPSIAMGVGAVPEIIENKVSGFIVPRNNPFLMAEYIKELLRSKNLQEEMKKKSQARIIDKFSRDKHLSELKKYLLN